MKTGGEGNLADLRRVVDELLVVDPLAVLGEVIS